MGRREEKGRGSGREGGGRAIAPRLFVDYVSRRRYAACPSFRKRSRVRPEKKSRVAAYNRHGLEFRGGADERR